MSESRLQPSDRGAALWALTLLSAVSFFNYLDRMVIAVLVQPIKADLGLSDTQVGLVSGFAFALLYALAGLPIARIADRSSRVRLISVCLVLWSAMTAVTGLARNFLELFLARMAVGVGEAGCVPASHSLLGDLFSPRTRALAVGVFQVGGLLGMSFGLAGAGWVAETYGWRTALVAAGLAGAPLALLLVLTVREPRRAEVAASARGETTLQTISALAGRPTLAHLIVGLSIGAFATYGIGQWVAAFYIRSHGLGLAEVGLITGSIAAGAGILGTLAGGALMVWLRRRDARWELWQPMAAYLLAAPLFAAAFLVTDLSAALALQFAGTVFGAMGGGVALAAIQSFAEPHRRATAVALMLMLSSLIGLGLGPAAVGALSDMLAATQAGDSLRIALAVSTAFLAWAALHFLLAARSAGPDGPADPR